MEGILILIALILVIQLYGFTLQDKGPMLVRSKLFITVLSPLDKTGFFTVVFPLILQFFILGYIYRTDGDSLLLSVIAVLQLAMYFEYKLKILFDHLIRVTIEREEE